MVRPEQVVCSGDLQDLVTECRAAYAALAPDKVEHLVFGEGPVNARLMLIGEAPGEQETLQHRPFVGKAGKNLDEFLALSGLNRQEIYITNTVKIRPTKEGKSGRLSNRPPDKQEIVFFLPWLLAEIEIVNPDFIAVLGNTPLQALAGKQVTVGQVHGHLVPVPGTERKCFALYHPASLIYNPGLRPFYEADIRALASMLDGAG